jgi:tetratricopeptide (TPR) repeat protein
VPKTRAKPAQSQPKPPSLQLDLAIVAGLLIAIFAVYAEVGSFDFTSYDDNLYVTDNPHVQAGLTLDSIKWATTAVVASNWMPVTLLSHMTDCQIFHMQPGMHHLVNVLFHFLASVLLYAALKRSTGSRGPGAFVAFVFALHPVHVESVAWIAERKDVLSACFFFLALYGYIWYTEKPSALRYALVAVAFALGLMAKPMLVTFPFVLLLFDVWPLRRAQWPRMVLEKLPLVALSAAVSVVTYSVQKSTQAVQSHPMLVRIENALIAYVVYIWQTLWPSGLAVLYPYQRDPALWQAVAALIVLVGVSFAVVREWRKRPYLAIGWFWFLGTLVPVIGFVQVGLQSHADRYLYIPMVGLLMMLAWSAVDLLAARPSLKLAVATAAGVVCLICLVAAHVQTGYWENSGTLFERAVDVTHDNYVAEYNLGNYLMNNRRGEEAVPHFEAALRIHPDYPEAETNLGRVLGNIPGRLHDAIPHFEAAIRMKPDLVEAQYNLALALSQAGRTAEAVEHFEAAKRLQATK